MEVAYASRERQFLKALSVPAGSTLLQAIEVSGVLSEFPAMELGPGLVGVWGELRGLEEPLRDGDRVEIYRPLTADPKDLRRQRAAQARKTKLKG